MLQLDTPTASVPRSQAGLRSLCSALFRHWRLSALFLAVTLLSGLAYIQYWPATYRSEAKVSVRLGRDNITLDPTALTEPNTVFAVPPSREDQINTVAEILKSRVMAEKVVDDLGPAVILGRPATQTPVDPRVRDRAIEHFCRSLTAVPVRKSNLITATYDARSPEIAQRALNRLIELYLDEHSRLNRSSDAYQFLNEETSRVKGHLTQAEERLRDLKNTTGLASPEGQRRLLVERAGRLEDALLTAETSLNARRAKIQQIEAERDRLPETQVTARTSGLTNEGTDSMRAQFYALKLRQHQLAAKYTDSHPLLQEVHRQVAEAAEILRREEESRVQTTVGPNKARERAHLALLTEKPILVALEAEATALRGQLAGVRSEIKLLNESERQVAALQREVELLETSYRRYAVNLEQARIDQTMETQRISSLNVVQSATPILRPVHPQRFRTALLALVVGVLGAIGLALTAERFDPTLRNPEQVQRALELPTLLSIPRLHPRATAHEHN